VSLFAGRRRVSEEDHAGFVDEGEEAEVTGVLAGRFVDEQAFRSETSRSEEEDHYKRMRKPHLASVHDAIPYTFYQCEDIMVLWI